MSTVRQSEHDQYCERYLCCRCQMYKPVTVIDSERLCRMCARCCRQCGALPPRQVEGLLYGVCRRCRGTCSCGADLDETGGCRACAHWPASPAAGEAIPWLMRGIPAPLSRRTGGRWSPRIFALMRQQLRQRTPAQLLDRMERRWFQQWIHVAHATDEDGELLHPPETVLLSLLAAPACSEPACEDGHLLDSVTSTPNTPCPRCRPPGYRFQPATEGHARPEIRSLALAEMRAAVQASPLRRVPARTSRRRQPPRIGAQRQQEAREEAQWRQTSLQHRLLEPPSGSGEEENPVLQARAAETDPVRAAALKRARAERPRSYSSHGRGRTASARTG